MKQLLLLLITVGLNVVGQFFMKQGMSQIGVISGSFEVITSSLMRAFLNPFVIGGVAAYGLSSIFWLILLSRVELSYAYPALALGYVLVTLVGAWILGEDVSNLRWVAVAVICVGVVLLSRS
ncbi:MAG: multidrug resistance protein [Caldilineaceae bacterium]|nr:multidrug resistance protein [Caldilineaceae bacterium]